ncbi:hypothetical protein GGR55DRAFT_652034 [Xylaria sp. FL0064]|nr:hypothetical protein GGR55DRAFT_652034 [Xylaria sp. FL0064]
MISGLQLLQEVSNTLNHMPTMLHRMSVRVTCTASRLITVAILSFTFTKSTDATFADTSKSYVYLSDATSYGASMTYYLGTLPVVIYSVICPRRLIDRSSRVGRSSA